MKSLKPILYLLLVNQIFAIGQDVRCSGTTCTTPGTCGATPTVPSGLSWQNGSTNELCAINNCPAGGTSSGLTGASDLFCQSCPGTPDGSIPAKYANVAQTGCVAVFDSCGNSRALNSWTDHDCLGCYGPSLQYARTDKTGCQANVPMDKGNEVPCAGLASPGASCSSQGFCPDPPTVPANLKWMSAGASGKCVIGDCPPDGTNSGLVGASDLFCQSCPGTSNGSAKAIYANSAKNACVASSYTCGSSRPDHTWTNADCLICNGPSVQYAKTDRTGCLVNPPPIPGFDVTCSTLPSECKDVCPNAPKGLSWQIGSTQGKCNIQVCPSAGTDSGIQGASDLFCQSCPGTPKGPIKAVYANFDMTACVASSATCNDFTRPSCTWNDNDCLTCYGQTKQYATEDKCRCQSTPSTSSSSQSSQKILVSTIILISSSLLF
ncbi:hypothetical protein TTHERM_01026160 (macronuclear) [Tetrahymena thermophila SB210]|uniref:Cell surface immobilization antigen n=1 Tax=Tetrahymena thermophila (strain SB210) TaxID=312017 RepID=Q22CR3_TETTS|nr:hypothetical protein TTHERM_01026160 [Tetrahymena thermophila SB210]EAR83052.1 hypothetical protein TTHERM_01026160 [Tetrahymena thermophila SB210]|eukprot:XP_001030715.1 hypothetical protein TTHERM_01026160 [Tetrahymena thermophila SB210]